MGVRGACGIAVAMAAGFGAACLPAGQFTCTRDDDCTHHADGACEPGGYCSYPDAACDSNRSYSEFAGALAGQCVDEAGATDGATTTATAVTAFDDASDETTTSASSGAGDDDDGTGDGPLPSGCDGIDCSGAGSCVVVDDTATCACDPGLYAVGVQCLPDPCDTATCFFVDADEGDDDADGSRRTPWQTVGRLQAALGDAEPGTHFLLRRDRTWAEALTIDGIGGALDAPIVVGAYGPPSEPQPTLSPGWVKVTQSQYVVVRDLTVVDELPPGSSANRPCIMVERSTQVEIVGNTLRECLNRGVRLHDEAAFVVVADNDIRGIEDDGIYVVDATWTEPMPSYVGAHFWIIDNTIVGTGNHGVQALVSDATTDLKIMGNRISDTPRNGITVTADGWVWVGGNVIARAGDVSISDGQGINVNVIGEARVSGNVVFDSYRALYAGRHATVSHNSLFGSDATSEVLRLRDNCDDAVLHDNLVLAAPGRISARDATPTSLPPGFDLSRHWYPSDCTFRTVQSTQIDFMQWQTHVMSDGDSVCGDGAGLPAPAAGTTPDDWDAAFFDTLVPDPAWERCGDEAGAMACDGTWLGATVEPIAEYFEADGFGWPGTLLVRQRYPAPG